MGLSLCQRPLSPGHRPLSLGLGINPDPLAIGPYSLGIGPYCARHSVLFTRHVLLGMARCAVHTRCPLWPLSPGHRPPPRGHRLLSPGRFLKVIILGKKKMEKKRTLAAVVFFWADYSPGRGPLSPGRAPLSPGHRPLSLRHRPLHRPLSPVSGGRCFQRRWKIY